MSFAGAGAIVIGAAIVAVAIGYGVSKLLVRSKGPLAPPDGWGDVPDDREWEKQAVELHHSALKDVRETAKGWAASITAFLGIGGTVAFVKGPETFAKLGEGAGNFAFWLTVAAALLAGTAIGLATFAAQGTPRRYSSLDGWTLKEVSRERAEFASELLLWSRVATVVAALAILVGFGVAWKDGIGSEDEEAAKAEPPSHAVAVDPEGTIRCGHLHGTNGGALYLRIHRQRYDLTGPNAVEFVEACPNDP